MAARRCGPDELSRVRRGRAGAHRRAAQPGRREGRGRRLGDPVSLEVGLTRSVVRMVLPFGEGENRGDTGVAVGEELRPLIARTLWNAVVIWARMAGHLAGSARSSSHPAAECRPSAPMPWPLARVIATGGSGRSGGCIVWPCAELFSETGGNTHPGSGGQWPSFRGAR